MLAASRPTSPSLWLMHWASMTAGSSESLVLHLEVLLWPCIGDVVLMAVALKVAGNSHASWCAHAAAVPSPNTAHVPLWLRHPRRTFLHTHWVNTSTRDQNLLVCSDVSTGQVPSSSSSSGKVTGQPSPCPSAGSAQLSPQRWSLMVCSGPTWPHNHVPAQPTGLEAALTWRAGRRLCWLGMTFIETIPLVSF